MPQSRTHDGRAPACPWYCQAKCLLLNLRGGLFPRRSQAPPEQQKERHPLVPLFRFDLSRA